MQGGKSPTRGPCKIKLNQFKAYHKLLLPILNILVKYMKYKIGKFQCNRTGDENNDHEISIYY